MLCVIITRTTVWKNQVIIWILEQTDSSNSIIFQTPNKRTPATVSSSKLLSLKNTLLVYVMQQHAYTWHSSDFH